MRWSPGTPTPDPGVRLDRSSWTLLDFRESSGTAVSVPSPDAVTADFEAGRMSASAGCNTYSGSDTTNRHRITITGFATTGRLCGGATMAAEAEYLAALGAVDRFGFRDNQAHGTLLVLSGPDEETRLRHVVGS
jgi:heat shock protein HslJ